LAKIESERVVKEIIEGLSLSTGRESVPTETNDKVQVVFDPQHRKFCNIGATVDASNATSVTLFTTPSDRDFYLVSANLSLIKDASSTSLISALVITMDDGSTVNIIRIPTFTTTAQTASINATFPIPIKLARNTGVSITNSTAIANIKTTGTIVGFTEETA
tara:strand:- start:1426 stop:1911 length:486 start_codon:yes stop_codon:yes gene_type:complete